MLHKKHTVECVRPHHRLSAMLDPAAVLECETFNDRCPIGTSVWVNREDGSSFLAKTRSKAWALAGVCPVVMVTGVKGMFLLDSVEPSRFE